MPISGDQVTVSSGLWSANADGSQTIATTDSAVGSVTTGTATGRAGIASGTSSMTLTNPLIKTTSKIFTTLIYQPGQAVCAILPTTPLAGSVVLTSINGTGVATNVGADTKFYYQIIN